MSIIAEVTFETRSALLETLSNFSTSSEVFPKDKIPTPAMARSKTSIKPKPIYMRALTFMLFIMLIGSSPFAIVVQNRGVRFNLRQMRPTQKANQYMLGGTISTIAGNLFNIVFKQWIGVLVCFQLNYACFLTRYHMTCRSGLHQFCRFYEGVEKTKTSMKKHGCICLYKNATVMRKNTDTHVF
jgi:hypothetical protein